MTSEPTSEPTPELVTTRVGGGGWARLIAVAVVTVLVALSGFAVLSRSPAPEPSPSSAARVEATTPPEPQPSPEPTYGYAVSVTVRGGSIRVALEPDVGEVFSGSIGFSSAEVGSEVRVALSREWHSAGQQIVEPFDAWGVPLRPVRRHRGRILDLLAAYDLRAQGSASSAPMPAGYTFTVRGQRVGRHIELYFEFVWPTR